MKNRKNVLSLISAGFIILGTIGFAFIPYYDGKIDQISENSEETLYNQSSANEFNYRASSSGKVATIMRGQMDILKTLNADELIIREKDGIALALEFEATEWALFAARMTFVIDKGEQEEAMNNLKSNANSTNYISIYERYAKKAANGTIAYVNTLVANKEQVNSLRKKKGWYWRISIIFNAIGGILAIFSSCLKENKNNTTPVKKENQDGGGGD
jgi:hypothetical protein